MRRILFFETNTFTGATRVTRTIKKLVCNHFETGTVVINDTTHAYLIIRDSIVKYKPDILFCSFSILNPDVIEIGKEYGLVVIVRQDYNLYDLSTKIKNRIIETYHKTDFLLAQTAEMKREMLSYVALQNCNIKVIENPIDREDIIKKASGPNPFDDNGCFHYLWVGRKAPVKDLPTLYKAYEIVHKRYHNTDLTLISDNSNPYIWMKNADCLVISSVSEASPNVLREALFLGVEVISTDCSPTVRKLLCADKIARVHDAESLAAVMLQVLY